MKKVVHSLASEIFRYFSGYRLEAGHHY